MSKDAYPRSKDIRKDATRLAQAGRRKEWTGGVVNPPVWRASTIIYDSVAEMRERPHDTHHKLYYGRRGTPTQWSLADALTEMEPGAAGTLLYPSGVAAVTTALLAVLNPGDELLMVDSAYEPTRAFCDGLLKRHGITTIYYDPMIGGDIEKLITGKTRALFLESPGSLSFEVQDIPAMVAVAQKYDLVTLLDNTWATPLFFPAIAKGIDLTILAGTKYIVGHSDAMIGTVTANPKYWAALRSMTYALGQHVGPDDAWLAARGLRTLDVRLARHQENALKVATWLKAQSDVALVLHPALPDCPGHDIWKRDFKGSSGLFSFILNGGTDAARTALIDGLDHFGIGFSWGGYESLAIPADPPRSVVPWRSVGPMVRLQIGLEDPADLIADLAAGLDRFRAVRDG